MSTERNQPHPDDAGIEDLLREVGARDEPSADIYREVEAAVHAEWQAMVAERHRRRRNIIWASAATIAVAVAISVFGIRFMQADPVQIASVARIDGDVQAAAADGAWTTLTIGQAVSVGETLQTDDRSRAAFSFADGVSVRLDRSTVLKLVAADSVVLDSGAIYVDSPPAASSAVKLTVQTRAGSITHIGTQYQVRTHAEGIDIGVREGRVEIRNDAGTSTGNAGESLRVTTQGEMTRAPLSTQDPLWRWVSQAAPRFDINDETLAAFLGWLARETGRRVIYASPQAEAAAQTVKLRGSIEGLDLDTALVTVVSTTQLRLYRTDPGSIGVELASGN